VESPDARGVALAGRFSRPAPIQAFHHSPRIMRYKLAIFDFDGTLADSFGWFAGAIDQAADRYRFKRLALRKSDHASSASTSTSSAMT
jgi:hypothetical protein